MRVLAGDIGGTKTLLAEVELADGGYRIVREKRFDSREYEGLWPIVERFEREEKVRVERGCFAIAAAEVAGEYRMPNLHWVVRPDRLREQMDIANVGFINDFAAVGYGLERMGPDELEVLQTGESDPRGNVAILGAGTGLGEAYRVRCGESTEVLASEGGHADFAPRDEVECGLLTALQPEFGHVSYERLLSGSGLVRWYRYLLGRRGEPENEEVHRAMQKEDPAAVVSRYGMEKKDPVCEAALDRFASLYGAEAGNLALKVLAKGGVYVAGGIAPRILPKLKEGGFMKGFREKGRYRNLMERMPVKVVMNPKVGLIGAAVAASRL